MTQAGHTCLHKQGSPAISRFSLSSGESAAFFSSGPCSSVGGLQGPLPGPLTPLSGACLQKEPWGPSARCNPSPPVSISRNSGRSPGGGTQPRDSLGKTRGLPPTLPSKKKKKKNPAQAALRLCTPEGGRGWGENRASRSLAQMRQTEEKNKQEFHSAFCAPRIPAVPQHTPKIKDKT